MGSDLGIPDEKLLALTGAADSPRGVTTLQRARARHRESFTDVELVELTAVIAWENASSTFNRALRIPSQGLWKRADGESR